MRVLVGLVLVLLAVAGCGGDADQPSRIGYTFPPAPEAPTGPLDPAVGEAIDALLPRARVGVFDLGLLTPIAESGDARLAWLIADLLRFYQASRVEETALVEAFEKLTGVDPASDPLFESGSWRTVTDHLIAWDTPAPPGYRERKAVLHIGLEPKWLPSSRTRMPTSTGAASPGEVCSSTTVSSAIPRSASEGASRRSTTPS